MSMKKLRYGRKTVCPCSRRKRCYQPIIGDSDTPPGGGKCWSTACGQHFFPPPRPARNVSSETHTTEMRREHVYCQASGAPHMRFTVIKRLIGKKKVFVEHWDGSQWQKGAIGVNRILYKLPQVLERVSQGGIICICEGEKDCDRAESIGITATCNPFGATNWKDEMSQVLVGARVTIIPDLDEPGRKHAEHVEQSLRDAGVTAVGILDLRTLMPDLPVKGDLSDYLDRSGDLNALRLAIETSCKEVDEVEEPIPRLPTINWSALPEPLAQITGPVENELHRLALLTACITTIGAVTPTVTTLYNDKEYSPSLYFFLCGPPGSGKSCIEPALHLVKLVDGEIHQESRKKLNEFRRKQAAHARLKGESVEPPPEKPERKMLIVPADSTAPVLVRAICNNRSVLLFDTEADSLQNALRTETGDASPALRKAWHGERVDQARVGDDLLVSTDRPCLSMVLSGTPDQILVLIKHVASGLTSRFRFIMLPQQRTFTNPFRTGPHEVQLIAQKYQESILELWTYAVSDNHDKGFRVSLTTAQQERLVRHYKTLYEDEIEDADAGTTLRSGIVVVRIATVLTTLRHWFMYQTLATEMTVSEEDFETALALGEFLRQDTDRLVQSLKQQSVMPIFRPVSNNKRTWLNALPKEFSTIEAITIGERHGIRRSTVHSMLKNDKYFQKIRHGLYSKNDTASTQGP